MEFVAFLIVGLLVFAGTIFLLYYYARKDTPIVAILATFVGWFFGFMILGILPYDIYLVSLS
jgi:hypothetical protein